MPLCGEDFHDFGGGALLAIEVRHYFHGGVDVLEELLISRAKVIKAPFAIGSPSETVLGAFAVAGESNRAIAAIFWEAVAFGLAKGLCHGAIGELSEARIHEVAQFVFGVNVVIAGVEIAIVFHREGSTAGL